MQYCGRPAQRALTTLSVVGVPRFELGLNRPKRFVLPLHYTPLNEFSTFNLKFLTSKSRNFDKAKFRHDFILSEKDELVKGKNV